MWRITGAILAGYLSMVLVTFVTFTAAYQVLRADGAFKPGTYDASAKWIVMSIVVGLIAAIVGGWVCAKIGRKPLAVHLLVAVVFALGLAGLLGAMRPPAEAPPPRAGDVAMFESMKYARQPTWLAALFPVVGIAGVILGVRMAGFGSATASGPATS